MSNFLAPAAVTAALCRTLKPAVSADVPGATVTMARPDGHAGRRPGAGVNVYLYQVAPDVAQKNTVMPSRGADGRLQRPRLALKLLYLLTFYGDESQLEPQRVMGSVLSTLQGTPLFPPEMIRSTEADPAYPYLSKSDLGSEPQAIEVVLSPLTVDDMSKLWSSLFQTPYALSIAYEASTIFIGGR